MEQFLLEGEPSLSLMGLDENLARLIDSLETLDSKLSESPLNSLFNISLVDDDEKSIILILDKEKKLVRLKIKRKTKDEGSEPEEKDSDEGNDSVLSYDISNPIQLKNLIETISAITKYAEILYKSEPNLDEIVYQKKFNPLNDLELHDSYIVPIDLIHEKIENPVYQEQVVDGNLPDYLNPQVIVIEYDKPFRTIDQNIYQRVFLINKKPDMSIYDSLFSSGLDIKASYSEEFDSVYVDSINGIKDGQDGRYWEFYVNGEIGKTSVDKQRLEEDDVVEWRLAESRGGCGGAGGRELIDLITIMNKGGKYHPIGSNLRKIPWYII
jgi:hypothetical protein